MSRFLETIRIAHGRAYNLDLHQSRLNLVLQEHFSESGVELNLSDYVNSSLGEVLEGLYKCRVVYSNRFESIEFVEYEARHLSSFKLVEAPELEYSFKYEDRTPLLHYQKKHEEFDDVIFTKNGFLTDSSYANLVFFDGSDYFTPETPLLKGTMREFLLKQGELKTLKIHQKDIKKFEAFGIINSMLPLGQCLYSVDKICA